MGLWRRREVLELNAPTVGRDWRAGSDWLVWEAPRNIVAGESFYQDALYRAAGLREPGEDGVTLPVDVRLVREKGNSRDHNAFKALVNGLLVGYLRAEIAAQLAPVCDQARCKEFTVCGVLRGGGVGFESVGCHIWIDRLVTPGPEITFPKGDKSWAVYWPPKSL